MTNRTFQPGFRLSPFDVVVLIAGGTASAFAMKVDRWLAIAVAFVVLHFFLFCNILRMSRPLELIWAGIFSALAAATISTGRPSWPIVFALSSLATAIVAVIEARRPSYHGVGWRLLNPRLPDGWQSASVGGDEKRGRPARLESWLAWAERLQTASMYFEEDFRAAANAMSQETFDELAAFYLKAERENHLKTINDWLRRQGGAPMGLEEKGIRNLFVLFGCVGQVWGRRPFTSQVLNASKLLPPAPDWSKLPAEMRFIARAAEDCFRFGYVFSEEGRESVRNEVKPQEVERLSLVAEGVRRVGFEKFKAWWKPMSMDAHVEASMVFNLMGVLDALGLPYYEKV